jgi:intein/homing endonuclease
MNTFKSFFESTAVTSSNKVINLYEGIDHVEALPHKDFISAIRNIANFIASEKLDGCLDGDVLLETLEDGHKTIREIVENKLDCYVKCYDHKTNEIIFAPPLGYSAKEQTKQYWLEIETESGDSIKLTNNHLVYFPEFDCYRRADELKEGDILSVDK